MATEYVRIVDPDAGAGYHYTSLAAWEAAQQGDLTGVRDEIAVAKCRCTGGTADTTEITIDGWTVSSTQYIKIWTDPAESYRHNGTYQTGNKYRLAVSRANDAFFYCVEKDVKIEGIQFYNTNTTGGGGVLVSDDTDSLVMNILIKGCIIKGPGGSASGAGIFMGGAATGSKVNIINCIIYDTGNSSDPTNTAGIKQHTSSYETSLIANNTLHNCYLAVSAHGDGPFILKNNLVAASTLGFEQAYGSPNAASTNNASNLASDAPGANARNSQTYTFEDESGDDFHLESNDAGALGYGANLYNDSTYPFQDDIDGDDRGGSGQPWDIGADEYVVSVIAGDTCWGHDTGVTQTNILNFADWTGTGAVENTGDSERIALNSGEYMESPIVQISGTVEVLLNSYAGSGDTVILKYKTAATEGGIAGASWTTYSGSFTSLGYVQLRVEVA